MLWWSTKCQGINVFIGGLDWVGAGGIVCSVLGGVFGGGLVGLGGARGVDMLLRVFLAAIGGV